ncbi:ABC-type multidrug transport system, ATPase component [Arthrobacter sp. PAMC 25486]|uniref:ABC transporter ATP-binding protein n=1 Tax=Arthrobacter sp. PAMC 25486 TaxID=1494608 RepID=UPI000536140F|nr:ABC transporter ATP-binding protein [Arthrobacter sp. PAMC 25486]AIY01998.1 ABC-type multidrug transport system, ATPase component [Arthrobacter sp. PAMC 25486]
MTEFQPPPPNAAEPDPEAPRPPEPTSPETFLGLSATGLSRSFGEVHAVVQMDVQAPAGQVTALIGPNGAGKTTLLLMLASLLAPDTGSISVMGIDPVKDPAAARAKIGWMPDTLGVWEALTAREILTTMGKFYHLPKAQIPGRVEELLELVNLSSLADQKARVLSRGQQQRLSLARALIHDPEVLLLDEPASGLDPGSRIALRSILRRLAAEGKVVVVSSHVLAELDEIADGAVFVNQGRSVLAQSVEQAAGQGRKYSIAALDPADLAAALTTLGVAFEPGTGRRPSASVSVEREEHAAALLRDLVAAGVAVCAFAPATGALEETYMSMKVEQP